jgi:hypothetical protein
VFLDQVIFQNQRFHFGVSNDVFEIFDSLHHSKDFWRFTLGALKVLADTVMQVYGLSHIEDQIALVHNVYAGFVGELFELFLNIKQ